MVLTEIKPRDLNEKTGDTIKLNFSSNSLEGFECDVSCNADDQKSLKYN
jgi:hypothetical protein